MTTVNANTMPVASTPMKKRRRRHCRSRKLTKSMLRERTCELVVHDETLTSLCARSLSIAFQCMTRPGRSRSGRADRGECVECECVRERGDRKTVEHLVVA